jgi:putative SOS response-associated peptidase YedK
MCGRYAMDKKTDELIVEFVADGNDFQDWLPRYSLAPTDTVPIVRERKNNDTGQVTRVIDSAVWDFHPSFMKDSKRPQFNARLETVNSNGLWKSAFASTRCIVPMRGYYEWSEIVVDGKKIKQPHFIHGGEDLLSAAGIYTARKVDDEWVVSTAIITREAKDASGEVHDRMPVFLTPDVYDRWLSPQKLATDEERNSELDMLEHVSGEVASTVDQYEVDRKVNNSRTADPTDPTLVMPV